jgi:hypothetical protein
MQSGAPKASPGTTATCARSIRYLQAVNGGGGGGWWVEAAAGGRGCSVPGQRWRQGRRARMARGGGQQHVAACALQPLAVQGCGVGRGSEIMDLRSHGAAPAKARSIGLELCRQRPGQGSHTMHSMHAPRPGATGPANTRPQLLYTHTASSPIQLRGRWRCAPPPTCRSCQSLARRQRWPPWRRARRTGSSPAARRMRLRVFTCTRLRAPGLAARRAWRHSGGGAAGQQAALA